MDAQPFYTPTPPVHVLHRVKQRKLVENNRANILREFKFRTVKQLLASQPDIVVVGREQKRQQTKKTQKWEQQHWRRGTKGKYQELSEICETVWEMKSKVISGGKTCDPKTLADTRSDIWGLCQEGCSSNTENYLMFVMISFAYFVFAHTSICTNDRVSMPQYWTAHNINSLKVSPTEALNFKLWANSS